VAAKAVVGPAVEPSVRTGASPPAGSSPPSVRTGARSRAPVGGPQQQGLASDRLPAQIQQGDPERPQKRRASRTTPPPYARLHQGVRGWRPGPVQTTADHLASATCMPATSWNAPAIAASWPARAVGRNCTECPA